MQLNALMERVHAAYPDEFTREYWDPAAQRVCAGSGDTLAEFIVKELADTYDQAGTDKDQLDEAVRVLQRAVAELESVIQALE